MQSLPAALGRRGQGTWSFAVDGFIWVCQGTMEFIAVQSKMPLCSQEDVLRCLKRTLLYLEEEGFFVSDDVISCISIV